MLKLDKMFGEKQENIKNKTNIETMRLKWWSCTSQLVLVNQK